MCRSIKKLRSTETPATETEMQEAALQYVRKVSGYRKPSRANQAAFDAAVAEVAQSTRRLLEELDKKDSLEEIMRGISKSAQSRGLTEEIMNEILNDE